MKVKMSSIGLLVMFLGFAPMFALANDQIVSTVTNGTGTQATIVNNGVPSGTIHALVHLCGFRPAVWPVRHIQPRTFGSGRRQRGRLLCPTQSRSILSRTAKVHRSVSPQFNSLTVSGVG